MKSKFFLFAVSAVALTACTSEDVVNDVAASHNVIGFENVVNKVSRAEDLTTGNLGQFNVFGFYTTPKTDEEGNDVISTVAVPVFYDTPVTYSTTNNAWVMADADVRHWVPGGHYYFHAYSCGSISKLDTEKYGEFAMDMADGLTPSDRVLLIKNYICDDTHQHDLIYASNTGATAENKWHGIVATEQGNPKVAFQFQHILAKVNAQIISKFPADYKVFVSDVTLENIRNIGSYNPNAIGGWQDQARKNSVRNFVSLIKTGTISTKASDATGAFTPWAYVIPYQYTTSAGVTETGVTLNFHITVKFHDEIVFEKDMIGRFHPNWEAGYKYTYNVEVSGTSSKLQTIVFTTVTDEDGGAVTKWGNGTDDPTVTIE